MRLPEFKGKTALSNVPILFWGIILSALVAGLIFTAIARFATGNAGGSKSALADYPAYVKAVQASSKDQQVILRSSVLGSWKALKGTTQMILEFDPKGHFILRVSNKETPYYILVAHGRYSSFPLKETAGVLLSERRNEPVPLRKPAPYYKFRNLDVYETAFSWNTQNDTLSLQLLNSPKPHKNFEALFSEFAAGDGAVVFEKIKRRAIRNR